jgi:hypothetical protein
VAVQGVRESQAYVHELRRLAQEPGQGSALQDLRIPDGALRCDPPVDLQDQGHGQEEQRAHPCAQHEHPELEPLQVPSAPPSQVRGQGKVTRG